MLRHARAIPGAGRSPGSRAPGSRGWLGHLLDAARRAAQALGRVTLRLLDRLDLVPRVPDEDEIFVVLLGGRLDRDSAGDPRAVETTLRDAS